MHVGSVNHKVAGSLVVGGYDSSRCIGEPIVSDSQSVQLSKITLGVVSGGSAFINAPPSSTNLLKSSDGTNSLETYPNPAVPYLYLPKDTCDAIAAHLPVTYSEEFNLYFWNTEDQAYQSIVSSPHSLGFTFTSSNGQSSYIRIPFALLDLTLDQPLVSQPTAYFPCSPWTSESTPYHLGRAFLQGAFLAQNWQTNKLFLAQAPGPDLSSLPQYVKNIKSSDTSLAPATNPPDWAETWAGVLKALPYDTDSVESGSNGGSSSGDSGDSGLSNGAIAGIVVWGRCWSGLDGRTPNLVHSEKKTRYNISIARDYPRSLGA